MAQNAPTFRVAQTKRQMYEQLRGQLDRERSSFIPVWRELAENFLPRRARFQITDNNRGDRRNTKIYDSTPTFAARTLRSGMMGGISSPARPWFRLTTPEPEYAELGSVKQWLELVTRRMSTVFLRSNLYQALPILYGDIGVFGTHALLIEEDFDRVLRFQPFPIGTYWISTDAKGKVNVFMREYRMTVRALVEEFGQRDKNGKIDWSNFSLQVKGLYDSGNLEAWIDVVHVVAPNQDYQPGAYVRSKFKRFSSCYYERGTTRGTNQAHDNADLEGKFLRESGYDYFPVLVPRWEVAEGDAYGTDCPGMVGLGDAKQLQTMVKRLMQAIEKMVNPPMVADASLRNAKTTLLPGDTTWVEGESEQKKKFRPAHEVNPRVAELMEAIRQTQARINRAMFADLFLMTAESDRRNVTATEIDERREEKFLVLGPVLEQLAATFDDLIDITFTIMLRQGLIPDAPEEIQGQELKVEYVSVMAQAQKLSALGGIERFTNFVTNLAAARQDPSVWDKVNSDNLIDHYGDITSIMTDVLVPDDQVAGIRQQRQSAQDALAKSEALRNETAAVKDLGQTPIDGNNALGELLRQSGAGAIA